MTFSPGTLPSMVTHVPEKENYQFLYWTSRKDDKTTKLRDVYFYSYENETGFIIYAYYQERINPNNVIGLNEFIQFKNNTYNVSITSVERVDSY